MDHDVIFIDNVEHFLKHFGKPIICDTTNNNKEDIINGRLNVTCSMKYNAYPSPGVPYYESDNNTSPSMSLEELNKLILDLDQERHNMIDAMKEKELRASEFENVLKRIWLDLCDIYDKKSCIKEVSRSTLHYIYNSLSVYMKHCSDYADRDLSKKIKKEIEQTKLTNYE
jgi:hypothetical protein